MSSLHHLAMTTADLDASTAFYDTVLGELGYERGHTSAHLRTWHGQQPEILVYVVEGQDTTPHTLGRPGWHHAAFSVETRDVVTAVHKAATNGGWRILIEPREYPEYSDGYYAVFLLDPDGLKIEIAYIPTPTS